MINDNLQAELNFTWESPIYYKRSYLTPKKELMGWDKDEGFVHSLNKNLTASGGKLAVFRVSTIGAKAGYMVFDGKDELNHFFDVKYL